MWVGFFNKKLPIAEPLEAQVQQWYRVSMTQKCTACPFCMDQKIYGSRSDSETSVSSAQEIL